MWCATMALNGLIQKGVPTDFTHMIGHELTALYEIGSRPNTWATIIAPNLYRVMFDTKKEKLAHMAKGYLTFREIPSKKKAEKAIEATVAFFHQINMGTVYPKTPKNMTVPPILSSCRI